MYRLPQEIEVWYIIPGIRKELSKILTSKHKLTLEKAGNILGISKAAVSQYLNKKRGSAIRFPEKIRKEIEIAADRLVKDEKLAVKEILRILKLMKNTGCCCSVCKKYNKGIIKQCKMNPSKGE